MGSSAVRDDHANNQPRNEPTKQGQPAVPHGQYRAERVELPGMGDHVVDPSAHNAGRQRPGQCPLDDGRIEAAASDLTPQQHRGGGDADDDKDSVRRDT